MRACGSERPLVPIPGNLRNALPLSATVRSRACNDFLVSATSRSRSHYWRCAPQPRSAAPVAARPRRRARTLRICRAPASRRPKSKAAGATTNASWSKTAAAARAAACAHLSAAIASASSSSAAAPPANSTPAAISQAATEAAPRPPPAAWAAAACRRCRRSQRGIARLDCGPSPSSVIASRRLSSARRRSGVHRGRGGGACRSASCA
jgi:hypothetical protein